MEVPLARKKIADLLKRNAEISTKDLLAFKLGITKDAIRKWGEVNSIPDHYIPTLCKIFEVKVAYFNPNEACILDVDVYKYENVNEILKNIISISRISTDFRMIKSEKGKIEAEDDEKDELTRIGATIVDADEPRPLEFLLGDKFYLEILRNINSFAYIFCMNDDNCDCIIPTIDLMDNRIYDDIYTFPRNTEVKLFKVMGNSGYNFLICALSKMDLTEELMNKKSLNNNQWSHNLIENFVNKEEILKRLRIDYVLR